MSLLSFNGLLSLADKKGRIEHPQNLYSGFRQAILDSGLIDLSIQGYPYTWVRFKGKPNCDEEGLDRAFVNVRWLDVFS